MKNTEIISNISDSFALALGGGAARGLAHIGVIRRLEELQLRPVEIAGTSMGAIIAALYALDFDSAAMEKIAKDTRLFSLVDFDLSHGIFEGTKIIELFREYFGNVQIENLRIPLTIVATNIDTGEKVYFRKGSLLDAVRASMSIPGIFAPYKINGKNLVDGGLVENLPIEAIQSKVPVLAISVQMPLGSVWDGKTGNMFFSQGTIFSNSYSILRKTIAIMMLENERRSIHSRPDVSLIRYNDSKIEYYAFYKASEIIDGGYREVTEK